MSVRLTPSQTVGPFFRIGLVQALSAHTVAANAAGAVRISGQVFDGDRAPVPDAVVETCQPEGIARCSTDDEGHFAIVTVKPAGRADDDAPHLAVSVFARGLLNRLVTRMYFPDEVEANRRDALLSSLTAAETRTLVASADGARLRFDIHLQGDRETLFLGL